MHRDLALFCNHPKHVNSMKNTNLVKDLVTLFFELNLYAEQVRNRVLPQYVNDPDSAIELHPGIHIVNPSSNLARRLSEFGQTDMFNWTVDNKQEIKKYFYQCLSDRNMEITDEYENEKKTVELYSNTFTVKEEDMDSSWDLDIEKAANLYADFYHLRREFIREYIDVESLKAVQYRNPEINGMLYCGVPSVEWFENRPYFYTPEVVGRTIEILKEKYGYKFSYNSVENGNYQKYFFTAMRRNDPDRIVFENQEDIRQIVWILEQEG
jgi:hypothetical protein